MPIIHNEPPAAYYSNPAVSFSKLKAFIRSPLLYRRMYITGEAAPRNDTAAMALGRAAHTLVLEGTEKYLRENTILEQPIDRRKKDGKDIYAYAQSLGKTIVEYEDDRLIRQMASSVRENPDAARLLSAGEAELTVRNDAGRFPFAQQGRLDFFTAEGAVIDFKTVEDLDTLAKEIEWRGYYRQVSYYRGLLLEAGATPLPGAYIIGTEKVEPFRTQVYFLNPEYLALGEDENEADLDHLAECYRSGAWPTGVGGIKELGPSDRVIQRACPVPEFNV